MKCLFCFVPQLRDSPFHLNLIISILFLKPLLFFGASVAGMEFHRLYVGLSNIALISVLVFPPPLYAL